MTPPAVEQHPLLSRRIIHELDAQRRQQRLHGIGIRAVHAGALSGKTDGTVDRAGVHIDQTEAARGRAGDRTFSGTGRAVNGNGNMSIQSVDSFPCHVQTALPAT